MHKKDLTDDELWDAVVGGDAEAFTLLYNRYWSRLYKAIQYYLHDQILAEQVVHDVFVVLWRRREHLNIRDFASYIHVTARYHVFKVLKARKVSPIEYIESYGDVMAEHSYNKAEEKLNYSDCQGLLKEYLKPLPKRCREIFWLSRIDNLSNEEIASRLQISKRSVENQITLALRHLRVSYQEYAFALTVLFVF